MDNTQERELGWDDVISSEGNEYILLPDGDYEFIVESYEKSRFNGSEKMPPCNQAIIKLRFETSSGRVTINHYFLLYSTFKRKIFEFFECIGLAKKGEELRMNWPRVPGARGRCQIGKKNYNNKEYNEVKKFYPREEVKTGTYTPGQF